VHRREPAAPGQSWSFVDLARNGSLRRNLPLVQYEHRRVFKWVKLNVAGPDHINADQAQTHSGQAALHAKNGEKQYP